jgi:CubicO group peptidase (beta-lactamase class C family)
MRKIRRLPVFVACLAILAGSALAATPDPLKTVDIDRLVERTMAVYQVPGIAVGIVKDGRLVFAKGYGVRELGKPGAVDPDTLFAIASNSKAFTTAALSILVDEGKLHWDDHVIDYLPDFRLYDPYVTREFTIRDLLTHRSGLGLGAGDLLFFPNTDFDRKDVLHALKYLKPVTSFRSAYAYDNNLYIVAGQIIPAVTGESWEDFVTSRILEPLHMAPCVVSQARLTDRSNIASPHAPVEGKVVPIQPDDTRMAAAAGGFQCNVTGLAKWEITQLGHGQAKNGPRIFSEAQGQEMWKPQTIIHPTGKRAELTRSHFAAYGLGWGLEDYNGYKRVSHSGGLDGMVTYQSLIPELNLGVIVLTNAQEGEAFTTIALQITDAYTGGAKRDWVTIIQDLKAQKSREQADSDKQRVPPPAAGVDLTKLDLDPYSGTYADAWRGEAVVTRGPQGLTLTFSHTHELTGPLTALRPGLFVVHWNNRAINADAYVRFREDLTGAVEGFTMQAVSATTDFSFDFQDLDFHRVSAAAPAK